MNEDDLRREQDRVANEVIDKVLADEKRMAVHPMFLTIIPYKQEADKWRTITLFTEHPIKNALVSQSDEIGINTPKNYVNEVLRDYCCELDGVVRLKKIIAANVGDQQFNDGVWLDIDNPGTVEIEIYLHSSSYGGDGGTIKVLCGSKAKYTKILIKE